MASGDEPFSAEVIGSLSQAGYDSIWGLVSAAAVGAPHKRERWWCLATNTTSAQHQGTVVESPCTGECSYERESRLIVGHEFGYNSQNREMANSDNTGSQGRGEFFSLPDQWIVGSCGVDGESRRDSWWATEPGLGRVVDGCPDRVGRLKALGN